MEMGLHTDGRGDRAGKWRRSQQRAETVRRARVAAGVDARRLVARGFGAVVPLAGDDTPEGRALNRRVELTVLGGAGGRKPAHDAGHGPAEGEPGHGPLSQGANADEHHAEPKAREGEE